MSLKIGDKVKMTKRGFKFYADIDKAFEMHNVGGSMEEQHFTSAVCEQFAIHGIGTVKRFNDEGSPYVIWKFSLDGIKYHYSHYFELKDVRKLNLFERVVLKLKGLL